MIGAMRHWLASVGEFSLKHRLAVRGFRKRRADFYESLCDTMEATAGKKTLQNILQDDCERYGGVSTRRGDRKSVVEGKSVSVRVDLGGRRIIKKKKNNTQSIWKNQD